MRTRHESTECLIVGAGPAGLTAASELARHGMRSVLIEKETRPGRKI